jgi:hypothetical protein
MIRTNRRIIVATSTVLLLAGCSAPPVSGTLPGADPGSEQVEQTCEVGHWSLDVQDYADQFREYLQTSNIPVEGFAATGSGELDIATDGVIDASTTLRATGTIVAGDTSVPFDETSSFSHSGRWEPGKVPGTIDIDAWETVADPSNPPFSESSTPPLLEYTGIPTVNSTCDGDTLVLSDPASPFTTTWHRD